MGHHGPALHQGPAHPGAAPRTALPTLQISPGKEAACWDLSSWKPPLRWGLLAGLGEPQVPRSVALRWDKPHSLQGAKYSRKRAGTQGLASPNPISLGKSTGSLCTTSSGRHRSRHQSPDAPRSPHYAQPHGPNGLAAHSAFKPPRWSGAGLPRWSCVRNRQHFVPYPCPGSPQSHFGASPPSSTPCSPCLNRGPGAFIKLLASCFKLNNKLHVTLRRCLLKPSGGGSALRRHLNY